jgi:hypothetical protein
MAKYILVYEMKDYPDNGGGVFTKEFGMDERGMHLAVEKLLRGYRDKVRIIYAGFLQTEYTYDIIEYAIRVEPRIK